MTAVHGPLRMDNDKIARAALGKLSMEDDIGLNDSDRIRRMIELREGRGSGLFSGRCGLVHVTHNQCVIFSISRHTTLEWTVEQKAEHIWKWLECKDANL